MTHGRKRLLTLVQVVLVLLACVVGWYAYTGCRQAQFLMGRAYEQVVNEQVSVEAALDAAQEMADDYRACVVASDAVDDEQGWQTCMQEVDPSLPSYLFSQ